MLRVRKFVFVLGIVGAIVAGCSSAQPSAEGSHTRLSHEAYLWQGLWTSALAQSVATVPASIEGLRVLVMEVVPGAQRPIWPKRDANALADSNRGITAVVRIGGSRLIPGFSVEPVLQQIEEWKASGVQVRGIEIDHDCATSGLSDYVRWLRKLRLSIGELRLSITALPTWMESSEFEALTGAVDEVVLQVHAIQKPRIFDTAQALRWVRYFSDEYGGRPYRVALPTYHVELDGQLVGVTPAEMQRFSRSLAEENLRGLAGIVWFRLPVPGDTMAFSAETLSAVIEQRELEADIRVSLRASEPGLYDLVVDNTGTTKGPLPAFRIHGEVAAMDVGAGYRKRGAMYRSSGAGLVPATKRTIGWVRGRDLTIEIP